MVRDGADDPLVALAERLGTPREVERELERDALAEMRRRGRITYMGARQRRLARERAIAATHGGPSAA